VLLIAARSALYRGGRTTPATVLGVRHLLKTVTAGDFGGAETPRWAGLGWIRDVIRTAVTDTNLDDARLTADRRPCPGINHAVAEALCDRSAEFEQLLDPL